MSRKNGTEVEPVLTPGMAVLYCPNVGHHFDADRNGDLLFHFVHEKAPALHPAMPAPGTPAESTHLRNWLRRIDDNHPSGLPCYAVEGHGPAADNTLVEYRVRPVGPKFLWPATVAQNEDGSLRLDIQHPSGSGTRHYELETGPNPVKYDASGKRPHTWSLPPATLEQ